MTIDEGYQLFQLLKKDTRYTIEAYQFVRDALGYAQDVLEMGGVGKQDEELELMDEHVDRHLSGQQLCEAIRIYAISQYGYLAKAVLGSWGLNSTGSFGDIVYNLIEISWMKKSPQDRREHFDNVYDFEEVFHNQFEFSEID
jgi:uncharacterized repeat protein (TIGR04138 family)